MSALDRLATGEHPSPHDLLGAHQDGDAWVVRCLLPGAEGAVVVTQQGATVPTTKVHPHGVFEATVPEAPGVYRLEVAWPGGVRQVLEDPYQFWPTLGDVDLHLINEGTHRRLWEALGARVMTHQGVKGTAFAVWAPSAVSVRVVGDFNGWDGRRHPMRALGASGVWELFVPDVAPGARYKYEILTGDHHLLLKADPMARQAEVPPRTASVVAAPAAHPWGDGEWMAARANRGAEDPLRIYEVHLGSWRHGLENYRDLAGPLADHVHDLGFTHVELLPVAEHPFGGSWGYQVTGYYAPTSRFGTPDDFRAFVDHLHQRGIGVIMDWVPAHFPRDEWALARFDGSALYEHLDPRQGEHPDWGTLVPNYGRNEVRAFLVANALYWLEEFHVDGLRVDAVASMLYLDYSRPEGTWVPNRFGGRENLEAIAFIKEVNAEVQARHPGALMIAEESTAWPGVSAPLESGGLGFTHKWNMGWMHDTLSYASRDPVHRRYHHRDLTFGLLYAFSERFVLPLSHDEVVHGKGSLLGKMPGDEWQRFANLRSILAWMWAHPGGKLLFMGGEIAQSSEWSHERELDWWLLDHAPHRGMRELVRRLNVVAAAERALWERDHDPAGFQWLEADDAEHSTYAFLRWPVGGLRPVACVANFTPVPRDGYRIGLPFPGPWEVVLDTDAAELGGSGYAAGQAVEAVVESWQHQPASALVTLPPLGVLWLAPRREP